MGLYQINAFKINIDEVKNFACLIQAIIIINYPESSHNNNILP